LIDLDDPGALRRADPSGMLDAVLRMPAQCEQGFRAGRQAGELPSGDSASSVVVCGMGGSGVAGDVLGALYRDRLGIPIVTVKDFSLPEFCGKDTVVVCSSYSGSTAETLACFEEATARGCRVLATTSGGELADRAGAADIAVVPIPAGLQPRAAIGHLVFALLGALEEMGVLPPLGEEVSQCAATLEQLAAVVAPDRGSAESAAKSLAVAIGDRIPVVWGVEGIGAVAARRWKTQFNENAKVPAMASALPELDHNEVVGWSPGSGAGFFLVTLRQGAERPDLSARFDVSVDVVAGSGMEHREVRAPGGSGLAELMWLIMVGDATSVYLGLARGADPAPIEAIHRVKRAIEERRG